MPCLSSHASPTISIKNFEFRFEIRYHINILFQFPTLDLMNHLLYGNVWHCFFTNTLPCLRNARCDYSDSHIHFPLIFLARLISYINGSHFRIQSFYLPL